MSKNISKTLIVGLGGTGKTVIREIKKRMLRTYGEIPDLVKFIAFDTDEVNNENIPFKYYYDGQTYEDYKYLIGNKEFRKIPYPGIEVVRNDAICANQLNLDELVKVSNRLNGKGANGYRVIGRSYFLNDSQNIINLLRRTITELRNTNLGAAQTARGYHIVNNQITAYVIASLAGGTGSSAFQDISRMLQEAGIQTQYATAAGQDMIFGVFYLPKFFEGMPHTENININAYTALSELDYTLNLSDPTKYPIGSIELQNDAQDYHGAPNNGKRVHYSGVYLIDSLTGKGQSHTIKSASSYVASFIASSIAATSADLMSSFVNSQHKSCTVEEKFQNYSGLGYCELRFDRQELVKYLLNQKLDETLFRFKRGNSKATANEIAKSFITANHLNEGVKADAEDVDTRSQLNELTDSIINMSDQQLLSLTMGSVDTGKEAAANIETSKTRYLNSIGGIVSQATKAFARPKTNLCNALREELDKYQSGMGFGNFPDLALCLRDSFVDMKAGLEEELSLLETKFETIENELKGIKNTISENTRKGFFGIGSQLDEQDVAINNYRNKVRFDAGSEQKPTLAWLKVDSERKKEAVSIYEELIGIVEAYYKKEERETINGTETVITGSYTRIEGMYASLNRLIVGENNNYKPKYEAVKETVYADAYFKDYFESHPQSAMKLSQETERRLYEYMGSLFAALPVVDSNLLAQMRDKILELLPNDDLVKEIHGYSIVEVDEGGNRTQTNVVKSIDELFIHCFGKYADIENPMDVENNPQLKMLNQVILLFDTLWQYLNFNGAEGSLPPVKNIVLGVYDTQNYIFNAANGYNQILPADWGYNSFIGLGDPDRIAFMLMETAIPAFKLMGVNAWANEFNIKKNTVYTFTDKRLEEIDMIMPNVHEEGEIAWAYGWLFGLITNPSGKDGIRVKPSYAYLSKKAGRTADSDGDYNYFATTNRKSDIAVCHRKFVNDDEICRDILNRAMEMLGEDNIGSVVRIKEWVNNDGMWNEKIRGKKRISMTPEEENVIQNEIKYLAKRFARLLTYGLTLDNSTGKVTHLFSQAINDREAARNSNNANDQNA